MNFNTAAGARYLVIMGNRALGVRAGETYCSDGRNLVRETGPKTKIIGPVAEVVSTGFFRECEPLLSYPLVTVAIDGNGRVLSQRYEIPTGDRVKILQQLWPFEGKAPPLEARRFDLHADRTFKVGNFQVFREQETNLLVSPYYPDGGTVVDWMPENWAKQQ